MASVRYRIEWPGDALDERVRGLLFKTKEAALAHVSGLWGGWSELGLRLHPEGGWVAAPIPESAYNPQGRYARVVEVRRG